MLRPQRLPQPCAPSRSGSTGSSTAMSGPGAFERSMPALAQMNPWWVSAITSDPRRRTIRRLSRSTSSSWRGSPSSPASSIARGEGPTSARSTTRPSALATALCAITITSPGSSSGAAATTNAGQVGALGDLPGQPQRRDLERHPSSIPAAASAAPGELGPGLGIAHDRVGHDRPSAAGLDRGGQAGVGGVDHDRVDQAAVVGGHSRRRRPRVRVIASCRQQARAEPRRPRSG